MSYPPNYHAEHDETKVFDAIDAIVQATLIVPGDDGLHFSYVPFLLDREQRCLIGHVARINPQIEWMNDKPVDVIFHGPHAYISPQLYGNTAVPTWNYVNVEVRGRATRIDDTAGKLDILQQLVRKLEGDNATRYWDDQQEKIQRIVSGIVGIHIAVESVVGRFKVSKNYDTGHQRKSFEALKSETPGSLRDWLETLQP